MSITSRATLTVPCVGPRVRGSAAYLFPRTAKWVVSAADYGSGPKVYRSVQVSGLKSLDSPVWARGAACYDLDGGDAPEWLAVPHEWLDHAEELGRASFASAIGGEGR